MTRNDLLSALLASRLYGGDWAGFDDIEYSTVSEAFVRDAHSEWMRSLPMELRISGQYGVTNPRWVAESWDCDNLAKDFSQFCARCMAVDMIKTGTTRGNIAMGVLNFNPDAVTAHAINWYMDHDGRAHVFDAGNGRMDHLSDAQLATIFAGFAA